MASLRIGLLGAGFLARTRARCWRRVHGVDVRLVGVAAGSPENAAVFAREQGIEHAFDGAEALLAEADVDLVDLCVPNHLHRPLAERAAAAGKQVLCTKPLAAYVGQDLPPGATAAEVAAVDRRAMYAAAVADARAMVAATEAAGVPLHYGENWVHAPSVRRAAELGAAASGVLLEMHGFEAHSGSHAAYARDWRHAGGGALLRLASHPIGAMLWLKRQEGLRRDGRPVGVASVTAEVADLSAHAGLEDGNTRIAADWGGIESFGCVVLAFEDGARGVAHGSDALLGGMQSRLRLQASDHVLECNLSPTDQLRAYAPDDAAFGESYLQEKLHGHAGWSTPMPDEDVTSGQQGLCQAVAEAAVRGEASTADGALGVEVTRVVYAGYVSAAEGRRVALSELG